MSKLEKIEMMNNTPVIDLIENNLVKVREVPDTIKDEDGSYYSTDLIFIGGFTPLEMMITICNNRIKENERSDDFCIMSNNDLISSLNGSINELNRCLERKEGLEGKEDIELAIISAFDPNFNPYKYNDDPLCKEFIKEDSNS